MINHREDCKNILIRRRSIRTFKEESVPLNIVLEALKIARYAPSAKNSQPWRFIIVNDRGILDKLSRMHYGAKPLKKCNIAVVVLAYPRESPDSYLIDASLASLYLWLALECLGLGAVWIQTMRDQEFIRKILEIPNDHIPVAIFAVGWPAEKPSPRYRKPLDEITFLNKYGNRISEYIYK